MAYDAIKFKAIVHYICRKKALTPEQLGAVKLHKILWYSDIKSYQRTGKTITEASYKKMPFGPFSNELDDAVRELQREGKLVISMVEFFDFDQRQFVGKGEPDTSMLTDRQVRILDSEIESICLDHTAESISDKSHDANWQYAELYEELPVEAAAIRFIQPDDEVMEWARKELGLA